MHNANIKHKKCLEVITAMLMSECRYISEFDLRSFRMFLLFFYFLFWPESTSIRRDPPAAIARSETSTVSRPPSQFTDISRVIKLCEQNGVKPFTQEGSFFINALNFKKTLATEALLRSLTSDVKVLQERLSVVRKADQPTTSEFPQIGPLLTSLEEADLFETRLRDPVFKESVVDVLSKEGEYLEKKSILSNCF